MIIETYATATDVANQAAKQAVATLRKAIRQRGYASWALAGGTSPSLAYAELASHYADALDWSKVTVLMGDERCVPLESPDSNWGQVTNVLFADPSIDCAHKLVPDAALGAEAGAKAYDRQVRSLLVGSDGMLHIDLLWLGVGEDGHTLSLFPGHDDIGNDSAFVIPIYNSPKPPADRISLSFKAATNARTAVVFAVGSAKKVALARVQQDPSSLPIGCITAAAEQAGCEVVWLYDEAARS